MKTAAIVLLTAVMLFGTEIHRADSLRNELDSIKNQLERIERAELEARKAELEAELHKRQALEPSKDTVIVVDTVYVVKDEKEKREILNNINKRLKKIGTKGIGGAGGPSFGAGAFSLKPVKEMISDDITRRGPDSRFYGLGLAQQIEGNYETFFMSGGMGIAGLGNGVRIGGAGYGGGRTYRSSIITDEDIHELAIGIGYGGVILEKEWDKEKSSIIVGTLLGAGGMDANLVNRESLFDEIDRDMFSDLNAGFFAGDIHAALTYSVTSWFHLGIEGYSVLFASSDGFPASDGFVTINGGGRLRIMFGNIR